MREARVWRAFSTDSGESESARDRHSLMVSTIRDDDIFLQTPSNIEPACLASDALFWLGL